MGLRRPGLHARPVMQKKPGETRRVFCLRSGLVTAQIDCASRQSFITLQPHRITAAPTAAAINGTIDPEADSLSSEAM